MLFIESFQTKHAPILPIVRLHLKKNNNKKQKITCPDRADLAQLEPEKSESRQHSVVNSATKMGVVWENGRGTAKITRACRSVPPCSSEKLLLSSNFLKPEFGSSELLSI